jgi:hypothetical protein
MIIAIKPTFLYIALLYDFTYVEYKVAVEFKLK